MRLNALIPTITPRRIIRTLPRFWSDGHYNAGTYGLLVNSSRCIPIQLTNICFDSFIPLPKSADPGRVVSNVDLFDFELSDADMKKLDALDRGTPGAISWNPVDAP